MFIKKYLNMGNTNKRRQFIKNSLLGGLGAALLAKTGFALSSKPDDGETSAVKNIKPLGFQWQTQDPFLFCVHHEDFFPTGNAQLGPNASLEGRNIGNDFHIKDGWRMYHGQTVPGFPGHPHRGFETITVVRKGMVDHSDSMGASGRYGDGDVQWMTAGNGIQHAEMFPLLKKDEPNTLELFQIWLNLPKSAKTAEPHYKMLWREDIPKIELTDNDGKKIKAEVIAGELSDHQAPTPPPNSWAAQQNHEVAIWNIYLEAGATWNMPKASKGVERSIYFYRGDKLMINEVTLENYHAADLEATANIQVKGGNEECHILVLQGKPIGEPVVQHGPFVMNTKAEIQKAFEDYQKTRFGGWPWSRYDMVHDPNKGRFAKHANGSEETKA